MKYLIVGLGNIGEEYKSTRHNVGFMVLDKLALDNELSFSTERYASMSLLRHKGRHIYLAKPTTFMNASGLCVNFWKQKLTIPLENILVIVDDIALPLGILRVKSKGSAAGHNGLRNIESILQTNAYARLRIGIGNEFVKGRQSDYVLGNFNSAELQVVDSSLDIACEILKSFCVDGVNAVMNVYNRSY